MNAPYRRLACPGLADPMETGDGFLARLVPTGETIALDAVESLCAAARAHGNGIIEITSRGSIQVRGLEPASIAAFANAVRTLAIAADGPPVTVDPLAGLDPQTPIDACTLADALRTALARASFATQLGPKVSVLIDAGTTLHLDRLAADVRLRVESTHAGERVHVALGGDAGGASPVGAVPLFMATEVVLRVLETIAARGREARARDLIRSEDLGAFRRSLAPLVRTAPLPPPRPPSEAIGVHALHDGHMALGIGLAFGHTDADALEKLIDAAKTLGAVGLRTAGRALIVIGLSPHAASDLATTAGQFGFIVRADDPRRHIVACAGAPICRAAQIPSRALAPVIAQVASALFDGSFVLHLSGCAKGCAHHANSALTIVGNDGGCDVVISGVAEDPPTARVPNAALPMRLAALAEALSPTQRGDSVADALKRLGSIGLAAVLSESEHA
jgi:precorrin-3B synthase